jgi:single-strand DNA-binding protein
MNEVRLFGTLTKDPNIRHAEREDGYDVARFTVRVEQGEREDGKNYADNINVVAFRKVAELVEKKLRKDMAVIVLGHIHASFYTNRDGERVFSQDIVVDKIDIVTAEGLVNMEPEAMQALPETAEEYTY